MSKLPKLLYVGQHGEGEDRYLNPARTLETCLEGDGPEDIGIYELRKTIRVRKTIQITGGK